MAWILMSNWIGGTMVTFFVRQKLVARGCPSKLMHIGHKGKLTGAQSAWCCPCQHMVRDLFGTLYLHWWFWSWITAAAAVDQHEAQSRTHVAAQRKKERRKVFWVKLSRLECDPRLIVARDFDQCFLLIQLARSVLSCIDRQITDVKIGLKEVWYLFSPFFGDLMVIMVRIF